MLRKPPRAQSCQLCQRSTPVLTEHHLFPKSRHRDPKLIKTYGKPALRLSVAWLCTACHKHIHRMITERQLAYEFHTIERLLEHPDVKDFVSWLSEKPSDFTPKTSRRKRL